MHCFSLLFSNSDFSIFSGFFNSFRDFFVSRLCPRRVGVRVRRVDVRCSGGTARESASLNARSTPGAQRRSARCAAGVLRHPAPSRCAQSCFHCSFMFFSRRPGSGSRATVTPSAEPRTCEARATVSCALLCRLTQGSTRLARRCAGSAADGRKAAGLAVQAGLAFGTQRGRTAGAFLPTVLHGDVRLCSSHSSRMSAARMTLAVPSLHSVL
jgi:hypothetical protein